jgi:hypothetical protein
VARPAGRGHRADPWYEAAKVFGGEPPAAALTLSQTELSRIAAFLEEFRASGNRYGDSALALIKG